MDQGGSRKALYFYVSLMAAWVLLVLFSLGETFWPEAKPGEQHWTEAMFYGVCHQIPDRTFQVNGRFMAVNTRCFGIFTSLLAGWLMMPLVRRYAAGRRWPGILLLAACLVQVIDFSGNLLQIWVNTNMSRFVTGGLLGVSVPLYLTDLFFRVDVADDGKAVADADSGQTVANPLDDHPAM